METVQFEGCFRESRVDANLNDDNTAMVRNPG